MTREEAIEVVKEAFVAWESEYRVPHEDWTETHKARDMAIEALSAERTGEWVQISPARIYECSKCGQNVMTDDIEAYKFCHGCGAKMMGGNDNE